MQNTWCSAYTATY